MTLEEHVKYWIDSAEKDLSVANTLYNNGNYDWCLFLGHLVLEKSLKALYVKSNQNKLPPKIHDLIKLANLSLLPVDDDITEFFYLINRFNLETRYPEYKNEIYRIATIEFTHEKLNKIKELFQWLKSLIK